MFRSIVMVTGDIFLNIGGGGVLWRRGGGGIGLLKFHLRANNLNLINLGQYVSPQVRAGNLLSCLD